MTPPIIKVQQLGKVFSTDDMLTHALQGIDLEIQSGEYVSISGPSGCGKSTLLSIMGLLDFPTTGKLFFEGIDVSQLSLEQAAAIRNEKIGFIFQGSRLIWPQIVSPFIFLSMSGSVYGGLVIENDAQNFSLIDAIYQSLHFGLLCSPPPNYHYDRIYLTG